MKVKLYFYRIDFIFFIYNKTSIKYKLGDFFKLQSKFIYSFTRNEFFKSIL